jgi:hypothetical protein
MLTDYAFAEYRLTHDQPNGVRHRLISVLGHKTVEGDWADANQLAKVEHGFMTFYAMTSELEGRPKVFSPIDATLLGQTEAE